MGSHFYQEVSSGPSLGITSPDPVLELELEEGNDAGVNTIREYLTALLQDVWKYGEGFDGKRPFGNSGWEYDLYIPLVKAGLVKGKLDEDGCIEDVDNSKADRVIKKAIERMCAQ